MGAAALRRTRHCVAADRKGTARIAHPAYAAAVKRAEIIVEMDPAVADHAHTTRAISERLGARSYSVRVSLSVGGANARPKSLRIRAPLEEAEGALLEIQQMPGVLDAHMGIVDDYPPDDEPPTGVREPRRPLPPTGHQSRAVDEA